MASPDGRPLSFPQPPWHPDPCPRCLRRVTYSKEGYKCPKCGWESVSRVNHASSRPKIRA